MNSYENMHFTLPLYVEVEYQQALAFAQTLQKYDDVVFFSSAHEKTNFHSNQLNRYSFLALSPFEKIIHSAENIQSDVFASTALKLQQFKLDPILHLPPFQGGVAGFLSYDLVRDIEKLPSLAKADVAYPKLVLGLYDLVLSIDHFARMAWIVASGFPETNLDCRKRRALARLQWLRAEMDQCVRIDNFSNVRIPATQITSNFSAQEYISIVDKARDYIRAGDIFEVNLSQRFHCQRPELLSPFEIFQRLTTINPAPFSAFMQFGDLSIISSSPERFIQVQGRKIQTRPIKGTISRSPDPVEDEFLAKQLLASEKDHAENTMIVDLMRNDLSKVCLPHSVVVPQFCGLESYQNVHHLVSVVEGQLAAQFSLIDLLKASLPGGSISGAPKIRALEIIDELEPTRRGPYCGNAIYLGFDGSMDSSILIRTMVVVGQQIYFQAGGAITLDSDAHEEYAETLLKAQLLREALMHSSIV